ncbi:MAG: STAS domain-containing protein, partial [Aliifodinibius sp.]|nr:STAS domain-containing protein [candidate division Zixibacteria bacterium]NIT57855.1 STAS domain-containing protein [Fodinibius sp.]NIS46528.1 STAS domain-containing protein [candidate division Zixibacteria bacterium]NIU14645.1 STAS domain-containing protein [candidate division Zixibacteria bacterium]NIV06641.1 STAS domain-containing protein [candidate division Zixibacteria bacterium]
FNTHLKSLSENSSSITLDFSATERLDTAAVQTLIAFLNHAGKNNKDVNIKGADGVVSDAFTRLGLDSCLKAHTG